MEIPMNVGFSRATIRLHKPFFSRISTLCLLSHITAMRIHKDLRDILAAKSIGYSVIHSYVIYQLQGFGVLSRASNPISLPPERSPDRNPNLGGSSTPGLECPFVLRPVGMLPSNRITLPFGIYVPETRDTRD
jgi:hypothetical protein